jgi:hypothetical protein
MTHEEFVLKRRMAGLECLTVLARLQKRWDMRIGQLIVSAIGGCGIDHGHGAKHAPGPDPFYVENDKLLTELLALEEKLRD